MSMNRKVIRIGLAMMLVGSTSYAYLTNNWFSIGHLMSLIGMWMIWMGSRP